MLLLLLVRAKSFHKKQIEFKIALITSFILLLTPHKDVARIFEVPKYTLSTWKKHKEKIYENYERGLGATRVEPEKYEAVNKAVMKCSLIILDITSDGYIDFDIKVITSRGKLTNQEILAEIIDDVNRESDGEEEDPNDFGPIKKPGIKYASEALQVLEEFSLFSKFG